jgi:hypothetical protein
LVELRMEGMRGRVCFLMPRLKGMGLLIELDR